MPIYLWHEVQNKKIEDFEDLQSKKLKSSQAAPDKRMVDFTNNYDFELDSDMHLNSELHGVALE